MVFCGDGMASCPFHLVDPSYDGYTGHKYCNSRHSWATTIIKMYAHLGRLCNTGKIFGIVNIPLTRMLGTKMVSKINKWNLFCWTMTDAWNVHANPWKINQSWFLKVPLADAIQPCIWSHLSFLSICEPTRWFMKSNMQHVEMNQWHNLRYLVPPKMIQIPSVETDGAYAHQMSGMPYHTVVLALRNVQPQRVDCRHQLLQAVCHQYQDLNPTTNLNISRKIWQNTNHLHRIISWPGNPFSRSYHRVSQVAKGQFLWGIKGKSLWPWCHIQGCHASKVGMTTSLSAWWHRGVSREPLPRVGKYILKKKHFQLPFGALGSYAFEFKHPRYLFYPFFVTRKHSISAMKSFPNCRIYPVNNQPFGQPEETNEIGGTCFAPSTRVRTSWMALDFMSSHAGR